VSDDEGPETDAVRQAYHFAVMGNDDGKGAVEQQAAVDLAERPVQFLLVLRHPLDVRPQRRGEHPGGYLHRKVVFPDKKIDRIGDDFRIRLHGALVAVLLKVAAVYPVGRNLAVMHHRPVQDVERMGAAPPSLGVGGETAVGRPEIALVFFQPEIFGYLFGKTDSLEDAHILAAGEDEAVPQGGIDGHYLVDDVVILRLVPQQGGRQFEKIAPDQRRVGDGRYRPGGNLFLVDYLEVLLQECLGLRLPFRTEEHDVEGILFPVVRVQTVDRKPAAEPVSPVVHVRDRPDDACSGETLSGSIHCPEDGAGIYHLVVVMLVVDTS
jgi:hypothetical protein